MLCRGGRCAAPGARARAQRFPPPSRPFPWPRSRNPPARPAPARRHYLDKEWPMLLEGPVVLFEVRRRAAGWYNARATERGKQCSAVTICCQLGPAPWPSRRPLTAAPAPQIARSAAAWATRCSPCWRRIRGCARTPATSRREPCRCARRHQHCACAGPRRRLGAWSGPRPPRGRHRPPPRILAAHGW